MPNSESKAFMRWWSSLPRPLLLILAILFCATAVLYETVWMMNNRSIRVELGFNHLHDERYDSRTHAILVRDVVPGSPAEQAGLKTGDRVVSINGRPLVTSAPYDEAYALGKPGDPVELTILRSGEAQPLVLHGIFRASSRTPEGFAQSSVQQILNYFPVLFLLVGFAVLFLRLEDPYAWLLAVMFICLASAPDIANPLTVPPQLRPFTLAYRTFWQGPLGAIFYLFFAIFPTRSPLDKKFPWIKWLGLAIGALTILPGVKLGIPISPRFIVNLAGKEKAETFFRVVRYGLLSLAMISLAQNAFSLSVPLEFRRKSKVIFWGTIVGVLPIVIVRGIADFAGYQPSFWISSVTAMVLLLYPLSFAYAVVKHRVLEIPVLLRRSARFVLVQRGYFFLLLCGALTAIFLFTHFFSGLFAGNAQFGMGLSAAFGVALIWVSGPIVKKGTERIDRAFFRSSYDARVILQDLAEKTRTVVDRHELARLLELHIAGALHPQSLACYLEGVEGTLSITTGRSLREFGPAPVAYPRPRFPFRSDNSLVLRDATQIPTSLPLLTDLAHHGKAWNVPSQSMETAGHDAALIPECIVPIVGRNAHLMGLLVLGPRLSEEPYSREDKALLESVAGQAAISLENMQLAEQIANRMESDRRVEREMQIARDVQSRLFPQTMPQFKTLEYAGSCLQARQVGGDYYDFWDFGATHLALVIADISGKGISGALLMANLQANLRSRSSVAREDSLNVDREGKWLPGLLKSVNQLFYENTPDDRYATLFFAVYDDNTRQLEYANCGHNPPLLFRASGGVERLESTATVIGISPKLECETRRVMLCPNDVLVIFTDGVTEANNAQGNEFGEERLKETVCAHLQESPADLLAAIQDAVQKFSVGEQFDDLTLVVARAR